VLREVARTLSECVVEFFRTRFEQPRGSARRSGEYAHYLVLAGWRQQEEARRLAPLTVV
jgi:hypothetical protein